MRKRGLCCGPVSVCLLVCRSVTLVYCTQRAENIVKLLYRSGSPIILLFSLICHPLLLCVPSEGVPVELGISAGGQKKLHPFFPLSYATEFYQRHRRILRHYPATPHHVT